jgi:hypothetical protein
VPHLLQHGTSVFKVISERPMTLTSECRALGKGGISTYFNVLGLMQPAQEGLEFDTSRMLSESTTTTLPQQVKIIAFLLWPHPTCRGHGLNKLAFVPC